MFVIKIIAREVNGTCIKIHKKYMPLTQWWANPDLDLLFSNPAGLYLDLI